MTPVLVIGGAGYVGSHVCKALANWRYVPIVFDNLSRGHAELTCWGLFEKGDILDTERLIHVLRAHRPKAVLHFAGLAYVGESFERPADYYALNVGGAASLVQAMAATGLDAIVFSSSCATYGVAGDAPIPEDCSQNPISPYGASKLFAERVFRDAEHAHGIRTLSLRYFNAAGADQDLESGEWHEPEPHLLPRLIRAGLQGNGEVIKVFGTDYPTRDGTPIRDYVHVSDLAAAHVAALDYLLSGGRSASINLGTQRGVSVLELIKAVERILNRKIAVSKTERRAGDPAVAIADASLAREFLGWQPKFTEIETIVESAIRWHRHAPHTLAW